MPFSTIEEAEKHYNEAIRRAEAKPAAVLELRAEKQLVIADLRIKAIEERERKLWLKEALREFPLAAEFMDQIEGKTEDEIRSSAQKVHDRLDQIFQKYQEERRITELVKAQLAKPQPNGQTTTEPQGGEMVTNDAGSA